MARILTAGVIGLLLGLFIGWVLWPVEWSAARLDDLAPSLQAQYVSAVADAYAASGGQDPATALTRLGDFENPQQAVADAIAFYSQSGDSNRSIREVNLRRLAAAIGSPAAESAPQSQVGVAVDTTAPSDETGTIDWTNLILTVLAAGVLLFGGVMIGLRFLGSGPRKRAVRSPAGTNLPPHTGDTSGRAADPRLWDADRQPSAATRPTAPTPLFEEDETDWEEFPSDDAGDEEYHPAEQEDAPLPRLVDEWPEDEPVFPARPARGPAEQNDEQDLPPSILADPTRSDVIFETDSELSETGGPFADEIDFPEVEEDQWTPHSPTDASLFERVDPRRYERLTNLDEQVEQDDWAEDLEVDDDAYSDFAGLDEDALDEWPGQPRQPDTLEDEEPFERLRAGGEAVRAEAPDDDDPFDDQDLFEDPDPFDGPDPFDNPDPFETGSLDEETVDDEQEVAVVDPGEAADVDDGAGTVRDGGFFQSVGGVFTSLLGTDEQSVGDNISEFEAKYEFGIQSYDESFTINSPDGDPLGACGVGSNETLDRSAANTDHVRLLDVWLYDRSDIRSVSQTLITPGFDTSRLPDEADNAGSVTGEPLELTPGLTFNLNSKRLTLTCTIEEVTFLEGETDQRPLRTVKARLVVRSRNG